ncbi:MAG: DUF4330 domain-containing protein [Candidatus Omnitrophica bacterium]|nr:DUF4330 domain-containing protein [Candidatus Omnitrophota bacterium]
MRIIDEKGRLFGKINVIDFLVIFLLLCVLPIFYFGYKLYKKGITEVTKGGVFTEIDIYCKFTRLNPEIIKMLSVGDKELDGNNNTMAEILWLGESEISRHRFDLGNGLAIFKNDPLLRDVPVKLRLKAEAKETNLFYKDRQLAVNSPFNFKTSKYSVNAVPFIKESVKLIKAEFQNLEPEVVKVIKAGDVQRDPFGKVIGRIISILEIKNSSIMTLGNKKVFLIPNPHKKDMSVLLDYLCIEKEGLQNNECSIKVGQEITFTTDLYSLTGKIIEMKDK